MHDAGRGVNRPESLTLNLSAHIEHTRGPPARFGRPTTPPAYATPRAHHPTHRLTVGSFCHKMP